MPLIADGQYFLSSLFKSESVGQPFHKISKMWHKVIILDYFIRFSLFINCHQSISGVFPALHHDVIHPGMDQECIQLGHLDSKTMDINSGCKICDTDGNCDELNKHLI